MMQVLVLEFFFVIGCIAILRASPFGKIKMKPFSCNTCLGFWFGVLFSVVYFLSEGLGISFETLCRLGLYSVCGSGMSSSFFRVFPDPPDVDDLPPTS